MRVPSKRTGVALCIPAGGLDANGQHAADIPGNQLNGETQFPSCENLMTALTCGISTMPLVGARIPFCHRVQPAVPAGLPKQNAALPTVTESWFESPLFPAQIASASVPALRK